MNNEPVDKETAAKLGSLGIRLAKQWALPAAISLMSVAGTFGKGYLDAMNAKIAEAERSAVAAKNAMESSQLLTTIQLEALKDDVERLERRLDRITDATSPF